MAVANRTETATGRQPAQGPAQGIDGLVGLVSGDMARVNQLILDMAGARAELIPEIARHLIESGGKRLRPMLTLAAASLFGYEGAGHVKLAASVEFLHTATLLHDDVVDESEMRRGKLAARMLWGNQASVLVGDYLLGQAFKMMVEVGSLDALAVLSSAAAVIAEGEVLQLAAAKNLSTDEAAYMAVIDAKTAALFAAACEVGPIVCGKGEAERAALRSYGTELGLAFQLVDDILDYGGSSASLGKNTGDDFREGKITLPVALAYAAGDAAEKAFWQRCIEKGDVQPGDLDHAQALMRRHGSLAATVERAKACAVRSVAALDGLPDSPWKQALQDVVAFCVERVS